MADDPSFREHQLAPVPHPDDRSASPLVAPLAVAPLLSPEEEPRSTGLTYLLWSLCAFGLCGMHRLYLGQLASGMLYLFTFGLFGVGQLVDLFRLPQLVRRRNVIALGERVLAAQTRALAAQAGPVPQLPVVSRDEQLRQLLLRAAATHQGRLSVTQGVAATGAPFAEVEGLLNDMVQSGYVGVDNDPQHGALVYVFGEL